MILKGAMMKKAIITIGAALDGRVRDYEGEQRLVALSGHDGLDVRRDAERACDGPGALRHGAGGVPPQGYGRLDGDGYEALHARHVHRALLGGRD